jgi:HK97 gp10 family phage protein
MDWDNEKAKRLVRQFLEDKMEVACELLETDMKEKTSSEPVVDTGNFLNSFNHKVISEPEKVVGIIYNTAEYAPYIEFGTGEFAESGEGRKGGWVYLDPKTNEFRFTKGMKPRPIMRSALHENKEKLREFFDAR